MGLLAKLGQHCARLGLGQRCAVISDYSVAKRYRKPALASLKAAGYKPIFISQSAGEQAKTLQNAQFCYEQMAKYRLERGSFVVALGGEWWAIWQDLLPPPICGASNLFKCPPRSWLRLTAQ